MAAGFGGASFGQVTNLLSGINRIETARGTAERAENRALFSAATSRSQIAGVFGQAQQSIAAVNLRTADQLRAISTQIQTTSGTQRARAASSGLAVGSKSFLSVTRATNQEFLVQARSLRKRSELERQQINYNAQLRAVALENQARSAELQAEAARFQGKQAVKQGILGLF